MDAKSPTQPRKMKTAERKKMAVSLRLGGKTFDEIGDALGVTRQAAHQLVVSALDDISQNTAETAEQLRRVMIERLNVMRNALWNDVLAGDIRAIEACIKIDKRLAELEGLDKPAKLDVTSGGQVIGWQERAKENNIDPNEVRRIADEIASRVGDGSGTGNASIPAE